MLDHHFKSI